MDQSRIKSDLKFVNQIGQTLSIDERGRLKLELAMIKLNETEKFDQLLFWGRIQGIVRDYYIVKGIYFKSKIDFPSAKYFFCSENAIFSELPPLNRELVAKMEESRSYFSGQHEKVLGGEPGEAEEEEARGGRSIDEVISAAQNQKKRNQLIELDRLSYVVRAIEIDCALLPVGALKLTPTREISYDHNFKGLPILDASKLENYMHFRPPLTQEKKENICSYLVFLLRLSFLWIFGGDCAFVLMGFDFRMRRFGGDHLQRRFSGFNWLR